MWIFSSYVKGFPFLKASVRLFMCSATKDGWKWFVNPSFSIQLLANLTAVHGNTSGNLSLSYLVIISQSKQPYRWRTWFQSLVLLCCHSADIRQTLPSLYQRKADESLPRGCESSLWPQSPGQTDSLGHEGLKCQMRHTFMHCSKVLSLESLV